MKDDPLNILFKKERILMDLDLIKQRILNHEEITLKFSGIKVKREFGFKVLEISFDGNPDSEIINKTTKVLLDLIDDLIEDNCMLEVTSSGTSFDFPVEDLVKNINEYIYVETKDSKDYGYLKECDSEKIIIEVNVKGRKVKKVVDINEIVLLRREVKL
jgi:ribosome maturation factor RimP